MISARRAALLGLWVPLSPIMVAVLGLWPEEEEVEFVLPPLAGQSGGGRAKAKRAKSVPARRHEQDELNRVNQARIAMIVAIACAKAEQEETA